MEIVKLPVGQAAPADSDCISIEEQADGSFGLMGSLLSDEGSVAIVTPIICATREEAEEQGTSWAAGCDVATLYVSTLLKD